MFDLALLLRPYHHDRAVSMPYHRVGDAAHQGSLQGSATAAPNDYQSGTQIACKPYYLRSGESFPRVSSRYLDAHIPYLLHLLLDRVSLSLLSQLHSTAVPSAERYDNRYDDCFLS